MSKNVERVKIMGFRDEIKVKKDYFTKEYTKNEILRVFNFMLKRVERSGEILGETQDIKITQIDGEIITVEAKMKQKNDIKLYRFSLEFNKMEKEEFTKEAKIASPERVGKAIELKSSATNNEKEEYYQGVIDCWDEKEEREKKIIREQEISNFIEKYKKENILNTIDVIIENSLKYGDITGEVIEKKIVKIEGEVVSVAIKTKDNQEHIKIYRLNLDFDKTNTILYTDKAKVSSVTRVGSTKELQTQMSDREKQQYYDRIPDLFNKGQELVQEEKY